MDCDKHHRQLREPHQLYYTMLYYNIMKNLFYLKFNNNYILIFNQF